MLSSTPFSLRKPLVNSYVDVFREREGIYIMHASITHSEDYDWVWADTVPHCMVFNAGTRVLFLYPEVVVVKDEDLADLKKFLEKLQAPPYLIRTPCHSRDEKSKAEVLAYREASARLWVRQLWWKQPQ